jgi:outer membrane receptor protein involved in Fe transport
MRVTFNAYQDQQARSVADVVQNGPSVRVARGFGNYQELYMLRGFAVGSDDTANSAYESSENTPFAAIVYKPRKDLSVYANYSKGLQRGPVASGTDIIYQGEIFAPYVARQREAGVKHDSGRYGLSAAVFSTSQPIADVEHRVFGVFGEQRNRGLELSVFGTPVRGLKLLGGLGAGRPSRQPAPSCRPPRARPA